MLRQPESDSRVPFAARHSYKLPRIEQVLDMPVLYYSQLMAVAYGASAKDADLDGQVIKAPKLEEIAAKK